MASETTHLGLIKPNYVEKFDIMIINQNMDTLDNAISANTSGKLDKPDGIAPNKYIRTTNDGTLEWADTPGDAITIEQIDALFT